MFCGIDLPFQKWNCPNKSLYFIGKEQQIILNLQVTLINCSHIKRKKQSPRQQTKGSQMINIVKRKKN